MASSSSSSPEISAAEAARDSQSRFSYKDATQDEVLEDLSSRFILNLPDEELNSLERICFQVEQAHWFYEDFIREENNKLPSMPLKKFSEMLFHACPLLHQWSHDHEEAFKNFMQYKTRVPVCGAIMLNDAMDKCVLVKGWKASSNWGFPKGKINETEPPASCAVREVHEETGYNLAGQIDPADVIELSIKEQKISLFIVPGVPEDFNFQTKTRKEISQIAWFKLSDLPTWKRNKAQPPNKKFYLISPFIGPLKGFINEKRHRNGRKNGKQKKVSPAQTHEPAPMHMVHSDGPNGDVQSHSSHNGSTTTGGGVGPPIANEGQWGPELTRLFSALATSSSNGPATLFSNGPSSNPKTDPASDEPSDSSIDSPTEVRVQPINAPPTAPTTASSSNSPNSSQQLRSQPSRHAVKNTVPASIHVDAQSTRKVVTPSLPSPNQPTSPRKASSTADISPYLARTEIPVSTKTLQHLQLLETVAHESARMAPVLAARAAMNGRGTPHARQPSTFSSQGLPPAPQDLGVLYSSNHPGLSSSAAGFHHHRLPENPTSGYADPFQVRSRTSQAFHRPGMHNPPGSMSMSQNHLLSVINGARGGPISPAYPMNHQFMPQQPPWFNGSPYAPPPSTAPYLPSAPPMHSYVNGPSLNSCPPAAMLPGPAHSPSALLLNPMASAAHPLAPTAHPNPPTNGYPQQLGVLPNVVSSMNIAPPPGHNPLLSLLNGRPAQTIPAQLQHQ